MNKKNLDDLSSIHPLSLHIKKIAKKNKTESLSLMQSQNQEVKQLGFHNWHFFIKHIKNKFDHVFQYHPFNPNNPNIGLNPKLKNYDFYLGKNLDYGIDFYANGSQLRNRFLVLHNQTFNDCYLQHTFQQILKNSKKHSVFYCFNNTTETDNLVSICKQYHYNIINISEFNASHCLYIPFHFSILNFLFDHLSDFHKGLIFSIFINNKELQKEFLDFDFLIDFFIHFNYVSFFSDRNFTLLLLDFLRDSILSVFTTFKNFSCFDKSKIPLVIDSNLLKKDNVFFVSVSNEHSFPFYETFFSHIMQIVKKFEESSFTEIDDTKKDFYLALITHNVEVFTTTNNYSAFRGIGTISFNFFDINTIMPNIYNDKTIFNNHSHLILPSHDINFSNQILPHLDYDWRDNFYPQQWLEHPLSFIATSSYFHIENQKKVSFSNLCNLEKHI